VALVEQIGTLAVRAVRLVVGISILQVVVVRVAAQALHRAVLAGKVVALLLVAAHKGGNLIPQGLRVQQTQVVGVLVGTIVIQQVLPMHLL
jgi:hypothetical protein